MPAVRMVGLALGCEQWPRVCDPSGHNPTPSQCLCPMPYALCLMPYALCPVPYALCLMPYALCPMSYALYPMPCALCPVPYALALTLTPDAHQARG